MMTDTEAKQLFCDVGAGRKPFDALYDAFFPVLAMTAMRRVGNWADAEEVVSRALTKAAQKFEDLKPERNPKGWLFQVVHNESINVLRKRTSDGRVRFLPPMMANDVQSPEINLGEEDWQIALRDCLNRLRPELRDVIVWRFYERRGFEELKKAMCLALGTIHKRLEKGKDALRRCLEEKGVRSMPGSGKEKGIEGLLRADARRLVQQIASAYKRTASCLTAETLHQTSKGQGMTDEMLSHIRGCRRCMTMAKVMGALGSQHVEDVYPGDVLADYLRRLADRMATPETAVDAEPLAVGYFAEQTQISEDDRAVLDRYVDELMGLMDILTNPTASVATQVRLVAELRDIASERLKRKPGHERGRSRK